MLRTNEPCNHLRLQNLTIRWMNNSLFKAKVGPHIQLKALSSRWHVYTYYLVTQNSLAKQPHSIMWKYLMDAWLPDMMETVVGPILILSRLLGFWILICSNFKLA